MALESATYINDFVTTNPVSTDAVAQGDDHLRLLKAVLKASLPGIAAPRYLEQARANVASASAPDIWAATTNYVNITGTTTITDFADADFSGQTKLVRFDDVLTLTHGASAIVLPGSADITTAAGDHALFVAQGTTQFVCVMYMRADGTLVNAAAPQFTTIELGHATDTTISRESAGRLAVEGDPLIMKSDLTGAIVAWPTATAPSGWLECDGSEVSRTTYADLFDVIAETYGDGDNSTTFNLPDLRGEFIRGFDNSASNDPDAASRTDRGDGTDGDNVGTKQDEELLLHGHPIRAITAGVVTQGWGTTGALVRTELGTPGNLSAFTGTPSNSAGEVLGGTGANETRPRNVAMMWIIKT
jgi:microcystin-dependent protein